MAYDEALHELCDLFGAYRRSGYWYVWDAPDAKGSRSVIVWKPGMRYAKNMATGGIHRIAAVADSPSDWMPSLAPAPAPAKGRLAWIRGVRPVAARSPEWSYLLDGRGLFLEEIEEHFVSHDGLPGHVVTLCREDGMVVQWQARRIDGGAPKYVSGAAQDWQAASETVWGLDRIVPGIPVCICEGVFDALFFRTGVAILGSHLHESQALKILDRCPSDLVLCPDLDGYRDRQWFSVLRSFTRQDRIGTHLPDPGGRDIAGGVKDFGDLLRIGERDETVVPDADRIGGRRRI